MGSPPESPNGNTSVRVTPTTDEGQGLATRVTRSLVNVVIPKITPDHLTTSLRKRGRDADDRLERASRRLIRRQVNRDPTNRAGRTR